MKTVDAKKFLNSEKTRESLKAGWVKRRARGLANWTLKQPRMQVPPKPHPDTPFKQPKPEPYVNPAELTQWLFLCYNEKGVIGILIKSAMGEVSVTNKSYTTLRLIDQPMTMRDAEFKRGRLIRGLKDELRSNRPSGSSKKVTIRRVTPVFVDRLYPGAPNREFHFPS